MDTSGGTKKKKKSTWWWGAAALGGLALLSYWEVRRPLRRSVESKVRRTARNLTVAAVSAAALRVVERPLTDRLAHWVERRKWGLVQKANLPPFAELLLTGLLLDYTLYWWHVLTHRVPSLWRYHAAHHSDLDMDASTALRFHFGELLTSVAWRAGQIVAIGASARALSAWRAVLLVSILFHHSNLRLPIELESRLCRWIVTPRMHGIHHSIVRSESDSNWSSILSIWDRLHGTLKLNVAQDDIRIGVPGYLDPDAVKIGKVLTMPFLPESKDRDIDPGEFFEREPGRFPREFLLP